MRCPTPRIISGGFVTGTRDSLSSLLDITSMSSDVRDRRDIQLVLSSKKLFDVGKREALNRYLSLNMCAFAHAVL